jgi:hypothetical protein
MIKIILKDESLDNRGDLKFLNLSTTKQDEIHRIMKYMGMSKIAGKISFNRHITERLKKL